MNEKDRSFERISRKRLRAKVIDRWENEGGAIGDDPELSVKKSPSSMGNDGCDDRQDSRNEESSGK